MKYDSVSYCAVPASDSPAQVSVRAAHEGDLPTIVELHMGRLPHGFFVRLGARYLRAYHRTFIGHDSAVALVAVSGDTVVGFLVGAVDVHAHRTYVIREHGRRLAFAGAVAMLGRPPVAFDFLRTRLVRYARSLTRARRRPAPNNPSSAVSQSSTAVLTHVAVAAAAGGRGAGTALVNAFVEAVRRRAATRIELVTLAGKAGASGFYRRLGWQDVGLSTAGGEQFQRFVLDLS